MNFILIIMIGSHLVAPTPRAFSTKEDCVSAAVIVTAMHRGSDAIESRCYDQHTGQLFWTSGRK